VPKAILAPYIAAVLKGKIKQKKLFPMWPPWRKKKNEGGGGGSDRKDFRVRRKRNKASEKKVKRMTIQKATVKVGERGEGTQKQKGNRTQKKEHETEGGKDWREKKKFWLLNGGRREKFCQTGKKNEERSGREGSCQERKSD